MANKTVTLYQHLKINNKWTFKKAPGSRLRRLDGGSYYVSWYDGAKKRLESVGPEASVAMTALKKKAAELSFLATGGEVSATQECANEGPRRVTLSAAIENYLGDCRDRQGKSGYGLAPRTVEAYQYRLAYLVQFRPDAYLDEVDLSLSKLSAASCGGTRTIWEIARATTRCRPSAHSSTRSASVLPDGPEGNVLPSHSGHSISA